MMAQIQSYIFFDIETTGLPYMERNRTKITELSCVAVNREDIHSTNPGCMPPISKLTLIFNPERQIHPETAVLTGLTNETLKNSPTFAVRAKSLVYFLEELPKPVCLVAHNGNSFDYKILLTECLEASITLPTDLLCVDSLVGFRKLLKNKTILCKPILNMNVSIESDLLTDDDDWPELNMSAEDSLVIDMLCSSFNNLSSLSQEEKSSRKVFSKKCENQKTKSENPSHKLPVLYKRLCNKEVENSHRAEDDCLTLLECVIAYKGFLNWADSSCKLLTEIKPLQRK